MGFLDSDLPQDLDYSTLTTTTQIDFFDEWHMYWVQDSQGWWYRVGFSYRKRTYPHIPPEFALLPIVLIVLIGLIYEFL